MKHHAYHTFVPAPNETPLVCKHHDSVSLHLSNFGDGAGFSVQLSPSDAHINAVRKLLDELLKMQRRSRLAVHHFTNIDIGAPGKFHIVDVSRLGEPLNAKTYDTREEAQAALEACLAEQSEGGAA